MKKEAKITTKELDAYMLNYYPGIYSILQKVSQKNGFTRKEVRKYRTALRGLVVLSAEEEEKMLFADSDHLSSVMYWEGTKQGYDFWYNLNARLYKANWV